jgi:uncharacterized protein YjbI with pentapeptide repeats
MSPSPHLLRRRPLRPDKVGKLLLSRHKTQAYYPCIYDRATNFESQFLNQRNIGVPETNFRGKLEVVLIHKLCNLTFLYPHPMKLPLLPIALLVGLCLPAQAENFEHTQKLLSTKQCQNCDLTRAGLVFAQLSGANLSQANLMGANLSQANLMGANLAGANLVGASLNGANLSGAKLTGANLSSVDLRNAYLVGTDLTGTQLENALLQGAIGLTPTAGNASDFYRWGVEASTKKQYERAIENFNQTLARQPEFAPAQLGRGMARLQLGDQAGAIQDLDQASALFIRQGDTATAQSTQTLVTALKNPPKTPKQKDGNGLGPAIFSVLGSLLKLFLF